VEDFDSETPNFAINYSLPKKISYDLEALAKFCRRDTNPVLALYGGEPLLCIDEIRSIMDSVKTKCFTLQTNGLLLDKLEPEYVNRLHTILVSVDGDQALTNFYRGPGIFNKVIDNLRLIKQNGFQGELIARMTVMEQTDIYKEVSWLLDNSRFSFSSVHWQLNAGFWNDFARRDFRTWSEDNYDPGVRSLVKFWVDYMEKNETVLKLYPIVGVAQSMLFGEESSALRCGAGWINYAIQTDGYIVPCPAMWGMKDYYLGHISSAKPENLRKVHVGQPCQGCSSFRVCGGRCLYASVVRRWDSEAYGLVCDTVKNLIEAVAEQMPRVKKLVESGKVRMSDFEYMKYNGCEIIP
jgi:putative peptide-modifying radical SAM enzyme